MALHVHTDGQVDCLGPHCAAVAHLDVDTVEINDGVQRIERASLPELYLLADGVSYSGDAGLW
jgi:hypothetical protein